MAVSTSKHTQKYNNYSNDGDNNNHNNCKKKVGLKYDNNNNNNNVKASVHKILKHCTPQEPDWNKLWRNYLWQESSKTTIQIKYELPMLLCP